MAKKEFFLPKTKLKPHIKAILDFENLINDYYKKIKDNKIKDKKTTLIKDNGYLINKKIFDKLKEDLSYSKLKAYINDESKFNEKLNEKYGNISHITYIPCEQKIFKSSKELLYNLSKGNEYIIINSEVWKKFNNGRHKENEGKICYEINEINMVIAVEQFKTFGLKVDSAENGKIALEMFEKSEVGYYDCVFMDIMMPVMDGFEATKNIRSLDRADAATVPIIAMTANAFAEDVQKSLENGLNYHLSKPFDREQLEKVLEKALHGE